VSALEVRPIIRGLLGSILIVVSGAVAVLGFLWARHAFDLCGSEPETALGTLVLWTGAPAYVGVCAAIGYRMTSHPRLRAAWVGFILGITAFSMVAVSLAWWSPFWRHEGTLVTLPMLLGGLGGFGGGNLLQVRFFPSGVPLLVCSVLVVIPVAWVILFFE
jgi:hypothetical protein